MGKKLGGCKIMTIFATSNQKCGMRTAGVISSLFCATILNNKGITTPCPEPGNRPGVSALLNLTARSVVFICQNQKCYVTEELFCARERNGAAVFLPAPGVGEVPQGHVSRRAGAMHVDGGAPGAPEHQGGAVPAGGRRGAASRRCHQQLVGRVASVPGSHLRASAEDGERLHPHRASQQAPSELATARYRLSRRIRKISEVLAGSRFAGSLCSTFSLPWENLLQGLPARIVSFTNKTLSL